MPRTSEADLASARHSLAETAYQDIRWQILSGDLPAGVLLTEREIGERTGHGLAPVRSALAGLRHDQLIDILPRRGFVIRPWSEAEAADLMQARRLVEPQTAALAAQNRSEADLRRMERILREWAAAAQTGDRRGLILLDLEFHIAIARASGSAVLCDMVSALKIRSHHQFRMAGQGTGFVDHVGADHDAILAALAAQDGPGAETRMRAHLGVVAGRGRSGS